MGVHMGRKTRYSADREVASKSESTIERETALKWLARMTACLRRHRKTKRVSWLLRAKGYRDEALEHAALAGNQTSVRQAVNRAWQTGRKSSP